MIIRLGFIKSGHDTYTIFDDLIISPIKSTDTNPGILDDNRRLNGKTWFTSDNPL